MLRSQFEEDLEKLHNQFYAMGQEVLSQINRTVRAFVTHDRDLAKEVIEDDAEVNEYEVKLEKKSFEMIALQQPVSQDLRTVLTVLKAVSDLERMGDHAVSIARAAIRMKGEQRIPAVEEEIKRMGRDVKNFVEAALELYLNGSVVYNGHNIYSPRTDTVELRKEIGMVFQQPNPFPMTISENVVYGLRINGVKDKQVLDEAVEKALQRASIWDEVKDRLHDSAIGLSGGQQQRVCVARVLATSPKIILLDEPTSALDPISAGKIEETLYGLKDKYTMLLVTRSMQQASRISDKTGFFLDGDLIEFNDTKKMFLNPQHKETEDYISGKFG